MADHGDSGGDRQEDPLGAFQEPSSRHGKGDRRGDRDADRPRRAGRDSAHGPYREAQEDAGCEQHPIEPAGPVASTPDVLDRDESNQANQEGGDARADEPLTEGPRQEETRRGRNDQTPGGLRGDPLRRRSRSANLPAGHPARSLGAFEGLRGARDRNRSTNGDSCGLLWGRGSWGFRNRRRRRSGRWRPGSRWSGRTRQRRRWREFRLDASRTGCRFWSRLRRRARNWRRRLWRRDGAWALRLLCGGPLGRGPRRRWGRQVGLLQEVVDSVECPLDSRDLGGSRDCGHRFRRNNLRSFGFLQRLPAHFALGGSQVVVRAADGAEEDVEDVLFHRHGRRGFRLEFRGASGALRIARRDETPTVRADEEEPDLSRLEDPIRIAVLQLFRVAETRLEEFQGFLAVEPEGSAEPDDGFVDDKGPAVPALRLVRRDWLRADGTQAPGLLPGHRRPIRPTPRTINPFFPLSAPIVGRTRA